MDIVLTEVDRLNGLVTDLLDYARPRERMTLACDLGAVLDETTRVFAQDRQQAKARVALAIADDARAARVSADPAQLRQVVWNLLRNAAEAMPEGGEVTVDVGLLLDAPWAEIRVGDRGVGISREDQEHIFEPFFTTKPRGTGLGLALVHRIVTEHGGQVEVRSAPGDGTTVVVRLPLAADGAAQTPASAAAALAPQGERGATESAR
jgi:signal transduction histidine kinase